MGEFWETIKGIWKLEHHGTFADHMRANRDIMMGKNPYTGKPHLQENLVDASRLTKTTMTILAMFQYQYWCPNKKIKQELYQIYLKNEEIYQKELREKYNPNEIFKEKKLNQPREELQIVPYKESIFTKLRDFIQRIFHKNKTH